MPAILQKKLSRIQRNPLLTAKAAGLRYVLDTALGFSRRKQGEKFHYFDADGKRCTDKETLQRIQQLVLPPAWEKVWICAEPNGHLQATGIDAKGRKQYRYHADWNNIRNQTKYYRLTQFAEALPLIRQRLEKDLKLEGFTYYKVLALAVRILEQTNIRVGNEVYKNLYGSFGLTTLQNKHVKVNGTKVKFQFKGKKGVAQALQLNSRQLARLIQQCREIPGKELFQYFDSEGARHSIGSGDVNQYLKEITDSDFTAKDFRTWAGSLTAFRVFRELGPVESESEAKKNILQAIDTVASNLGNTRAVCRKYYIHPAVLSAYEHGALFEFLKEKLESTEEKAWISAEEKMLKELLEEYVWE
ncbi:MAG: DNA topoisomerase IB [Phycisphaerae bacterium]|nr:DNA topoisomerase IB [Saprospiraceae bacterium]